MRTLTSILHVTPRAVIVIIGGLMLLSPPCAAQMPADPESTQDGSIGRPDSQPTVDPGKSEDGLEEPGTEEAAESDEGSAEAEPNSFKLAWADFKEAALGLTDFTFANGRVRFRTGLAFQVDGTIYRPSASLEQENGASADERLDFRRIRLSAQGLFHDWLFSLSFDAGADLGFKDIWLEHTSKGLTAWGANFGKLRVGQMKEPFSLSRHMASNDLPFLEWALPVSTFAPGRNVGAMVHGMGKNERRTWAVGVFSFGSKAEDNASASVFSITGRFTFLPVSSEESDRLF